MDTELAKTLAYATEAHEGAKRRYTGDPYIEHPIAVAAIVTNVPHTKVMLQVCLLHDVVEDTEKTFDDIRENFGVDVAIGVEWMSDISKKEDGNRRIRKQLDREHTAQAPPEFKTCKLADLIHNSISILEYDPNFSVAYIAEMNLLLEVLTEGDETLWKQAQQIVNDYYFKIKVGKNEI